MTEALQLKELGPLVVVVAMFLVFMLKVLSIFQKIADQHRQLISEVMHEVERLADAIRSLEHKFEQLIIIGNKKK